MRRLPCLPGLLILLILLSANPAAAAADFAEAAAAVERGLGQAQSQQAQTQRERAERKRLLQERLAGLREQVRLENEALTRAQARLEQAGRHRQDLAKQLAMEKGGLDELAGNVRAAARDLLTMAQRSPCTAEAPGRLGELAGYLADDHFPGLAEIERLIELYFAEIQADGQVVTRQGPLVDRQGAEISGAITRLGGFTTLYQAEGETGFALISPTSGRLLAVEAAPSWWEQRALASYLDGSSRTAPLDISTGAALRQLSHQSDFWEWLQSGGPLVYPIILVGFIALGLVVERLAFLGRVRTNTDVLMGQVNALVDQGDFAGAEQVAGTQAGRPVGNIIKAGLELRGCPAEAVESGLSEAMLRELPRLERFLTALKVLAAVAPLLGLLGTVTGMINTFNVITIHGNSEPRFMAGGISEALITTELGLVVAIPVLVAGALLSRKAQRLIGDMEEKAVSLSAALMREGA
ncbi:MAG: MotA/TolQ/ExbB proton channel family protein [Pseudomonadota bacterium]